MSEPAFNLNERVEYRWAAGGEFVGEARVVEVLPDGRFGLSAWMAPRFRKRPVSSRRSSYGSSRRRRSDRAAKPPAKK